MRVPERSPYKSHGDGSFENGDFKAIGKNIVFEKGVLVFHASSISLGNNIYIGHNTILKAYYKNELVIGDDTWIGQNCFFHGAGNIRIGRAVGIGPFVKILTSAHKEDNPDLPVLFHELEFKEVIIEDGADIGIGSIVLPGVKIGQGAIVGAGSVVTKDVQPNSIVAGVPAKHLRFRYEEK